MSEDIRALVTRRGRYGSSAGPPVTAAVRHFLDAIKFEHHVFALPFAYVAMVLRRRRLAWLAHPASGDAGDGRRPTWRWRSTAWPIVHRRGNPRTARRHLPAASDPRPGGGRGGGGGRAAAALGTC